MRTASSLITLGLLLSSQLSLNAASTPFQTTSQSTSPSTSSQSLLQTPNQTTSTTPQATSSSTTPFHAFTGKIIRNKVRMRLQPNLDGVILRELNRNDMVIVTGESEDFYIVKAPTDIKGYVFRTFILDDVVEGENVNVRLEPDLAAPVIAQLHAGDRVKSTVSSLDKKWLEISPPSTTNFYVCKDYVEKIGDPSLMTTMERRREEVTDLLNESYLASQTELQKPYEQIHLDDVTQNLNRVLNDYADFPAQAGRAKEILASTQEAYLLKKIAYMESKQSSQQMVASAQTGPKNPDQQAPENKFGPTLLATGKANSTTSQLQTPPTFTSATSFSMTRWASAEDQLYQQWVKDHPSASIEDFYKDQMQNSVAIQGIIEPYNRTVKNKPGDYLLVNQANHLPIAYLYSSKVNLDAQIGHEVTIQVATRDNHNFAFPAYFVLSVE